VSRGSPTGTEITPTPSSTATAIKPTKWSPLGAVRELITELSQFMVPPR
jgi:hypothetical protein